MPDDPLGPEVAGRDIPADRAVLDRIVNGRTAVLLVGPDEGPLHVPVEVLPEGASEGDWLVLDLDALIVGVDAELTQQRRSALDARLDRIRREQGGGRFGR